MAGAAAERVSPGPQLLSIGQVLARLSPEFPDLSPSKLRFLEERGLVAPSRTASGYRKFTGADVERVRLILSMQRDLYLPLKVIRQYLDDLDAGREPTLPGGVAPGASLLSGERRYDRAELVRAAGTTVGLLQDAISAGVIPAGESFGEDSLSMLRALAELQRSGIEPRHLRAMRQSVERDLALIESALTPASRRQDAASRTKAVEAAREIAAQLEVVRSGLVRGALGSL